jgi:hypothetical protein
MPVGCLLPHAYDPLPIEFRKSERSSEQNVNEPTPNPIGDAHGLFFDEPDIISRAEVQLHSLAIPNYFFVFFSSVLNLFFSCRFGLLNLFHTIFLTIIRLCPDCGCGA